MRKLIFVLFIIVTGCDSKDKVLIENNNSDFAMYGLMVGKYSNSIEIIQQEIYDTVNEFELSENENAKKYDSLTHDYKLYLEKLNDEIIDLTFVDYQSDYNGEMSNSSHINQLFFVDNGYSPFGKEYLQKRENYRSEILKLVKRKDLATRIYQVLGTNNETVRGGNSIEYLDYHFKDMPPISILFYIHYTQYSILELENEFMKNTVLVER